MWAFVFVFGLRKIAVPHWLAVRDIKQTIARIIFYSVRERERERVEGRGTRADRKSQSLLFLAELMQAAES